MPVTQRTRYEVLKRDNHTCRYCHATDSPLTVDHVMPVSLGGSDDPSNLVAACRDCNAGKGSTAPAAATVADVEQATLAHAVAMVKAAEIRMAARDKLMAYLSLFLESWWSGKPSDWEQSLGQLYAAGLLEEDMLDAAHIAQAARNVYDSRFVYFCGVAWHRVRETQEIARSLIAEEASD